MNLKQFPSGHFVHSEREGSNGTARKIAAEFSVGEKTVRRAASSLAEIPVYV